MALAPDLYSRLEGDGALGGRHGSDEDARWEVLLEHLRDRLGCSRVNLRWGLAWLRQETRSMREFAREFERRAQDAGLTDEDAKVFLVGNLNKEALAKLDTFVTTQDPSAASAYETAQERLQRVSYATMIQFLKQSNLTDIAARGAGGTALISSASSSNRANVVGATEPVMTEAIPENGVFSGFLDAGVMPVTVEPESGAGEEQREGNGAESGSGFLEAGVMMVSVDGDAPAA